MLQVALFTCYKLQCLFVFGLYIKWALYYKGSHTKFVCQSDCLALLICCCFLFFLSLYLSVLLVCLLICQYLCVIHLPVCWFSTSNVQTLILCNEVSSTELDSERAHWVWAPLPLTLRGPFDFRGRLWLGGAPLTLRGPFDFEWLLWLWVAPLTLRGPFDF